MRDNLGGHTQRLASFVVVERPRKAKIRPNSQVALSAWELDCHASLTTVPQLRGQLGLSVGTRQAPLLTLPSGTQRARCQVAVERPPPGWQRQSSSRSKKGRVSV
jgi:hypothetical protein